MEKLKYKMIVTDMDYTLLNKDKQVSDRNKAALQAAAEKGVAIVVATGRIYTSALYYARLLGISTPIIASNGAIIRDEHTDKTLYQRLLDTRAIDEMIRLTREAGLFCHLFSRDTIYTEKIVNVSVRYTEWNKFLAKESQVKIRLVDRFESMSQEEKAGIFKAVVIDEEGSKLKHIRDEIMKTDLVVVSQSLKDNIEVMHKETSKGNAIARLAEIYQISREEIIAFGDNENDISMIEYAGLGIAVGNAVQDLKDKADYITDDYDKDGVAKAIEKFVL